MVGRVGGLRSLDAVISRIGRHLEGNDLVGPVGLGLLEDGVVEGEDASEVGIGAAACECG